MANPTPEQQAELEEQANATTTPPTQTTAEPDPSKWTKVEGFTHSDPPERVSNTTFATRAQRAAQTKQVAKGDATVEDKTVTSSTTAKKQAPRTR
jgi:hypothetical protein